MSETETVRVDLGDRGYDIVVGDGVLARAGELLAPVLSQDRVVVVTDRNVAKLHLETLQRALADTGIRHEDIVLEAGEQTKSFGALEQLLDDLLGRGIERATTLVAFGGGVIGDLAGLAAAIALRGIDIVQIPTTLLAHVDSSVGGKTAIDTPHGKNLVGAFHQPRLVLADTGVLDTLPPRELRAGYAEVVKYGLIDDPDFFAWLEGHGAAVIEGDTTARRRAIVTSCKAKAAIVAGDERESGDRALLNLGHTFAHALETETGFGDELLHGEAVAIGMCLAFDLSVELGLCPPADADRVRRHFAMVDLAHGLDAAQGRIWNAERLIAHMDRDKKARDGRKTFILVRGLGQAFISREVENDDLKALLEEAIAA
ncbi:MAG: 3-dehydroquinate synthase [Alphaproteobacteria bacterium]|nr:3-dehydroquinate synthase [Alphaproteobacteria bacterium]